MSNKKHLIVLTGPTAVGKTALSIALAKALNCEIISADSMQVYKYMDIGTAKIMPAEMDGVKHHLIDILEPDEDFNVVLFQKYAKTAIDEIYAKGKIPLIVGGTGFYIQALLKDISFENEDDSDDSYREELSRLALEKGNEYLHDMLRAVDPASAEKIHANNVKRVIRALEYYKNNNSPISLHNEEQSENESPYNYAYFVLNCERDVLYERIDKRIDIMVNDGLVEDVKGLLLKGCKKDSVAMQGLGYKEIIDYLNGDISLEEAIYILKRDTRHFAKRQITWFKREKDVIWLTKDEDTLETIIKIAKDKGIIK